MAAAIKPNYKIKFKSFSYNHGSDNESYFLSSSRKGELDPDQFQVVLKGGHNTEGD